MKRRSSPDLDVRGRVGFVLTAVLVLLAQVFAIAAPGSLVWCAHEDGHAALEPAGSDCCRAAHEAEEALAAERDASPGPRVRSTGDACRDLPVRADQAPVVRSAVRSETVRAERTALVAVVAWAAPQVVVSTPPARSSCRGPPPAAVPRPPRLFVLRC